MSINLLVAVSLPLADAVPPPPRIDARSELNCTLRMTNDHVDDVIMMQDVARDEAQCRTFCSNFADESLVSMRDAVRVLRYRCSFRERDIAKVDLKK